MPIFSQQLIYRGKSLVTKQSATDTNYNYSFKVLKIYNCIIRLKIYVTFMHTFVMRHN